MIRGLKAACVWALAIFASVAFSCVMVGCGDDSESQEIPSWMKKAKKNEDSNKKKAAETAKKVGVELQTIGETDFIASAKRRDPFSPFFEMLGKQEEVLRGVQREVKLKEYDVADLKLIGIVTNIGDPRAMVVTPDKTGFVLRRGDYVGRADFVKQGKRGETIQVNWRVARIHGSGKDEERGVYLVRDDPTTTKGVDVTRFIPLYSR